MNKRCMQLMIALVQLALTTTTRAVDSQTAAREADAAQIEAIDALARTAFYDTEAGAARGAPGTVIRSEGFAGYELPAETRASRILYRSRSQLDHDSVASAVVVIPTRAAPAGGWPFLVWAHGMTGIAPACAPSLFKSLGNQTENLVREGLSRGFAVVVVDYSGLGAGLQHEFLWKEANANDIAFAAAAARAAEPQLAAAWVAMGHSEGGLAVWGVAEKMAKLHDPAYRGAVAIAPTVDTDALVPRVGAMSGQSFYPVYVAFGIKTVYRNFDIHTMLLPVGMEAYPHLTTQGCRRSASALFDSVKLGAVLDARWAATPLAQRLFTSNQVGNKPIAGPMFVAGAESDETAPAQIVAARVKALCATGATVSYQAYPGDHETMLLTSTSDEMNWVVDRFQERPAPSQCK